MTMTMGSYSIPFRVDVALFCKDFCAHTITERLLPPRESIFTSSSRAPVFVSAFPSASVTHGEALGGTRFVNDALKQTADRGVRERSLVVLPPHSPKLPFVAVR